ncbi:DUF5134 domain-containing protein [Mycobacterium simiae]|uniref:DUF5134 domain-containing protein n=1 Tax=Mycobacterium simiae TaxID=1784 RepID=A0A5B1BP18_MYCSI|nr:DUF5134 domain-containing protein [Mycobacterium simiae]KAA1250458.1 DUF5134 domain-containing protein [Mycobacterium simiae]
MIQDIFLRWIATTLFSLSAAESVFAIVTRHPAWTQVVGQLLHFIMAVAMSVLAWPWTTKFPTTGLMVFFLLAALWFVGVGLAGVGQRVVNGYHALTMLAMTWTFVVMNGDLLSGAPRTAHGGQNPASLRSPMPGMDMPGMQMSGADISPSSIGASVWIDAVSWLCTIGFVAATIWWVYRLFALRKAEPPPPRQRFLEEASLAAMAAGMAIMFGVML